MLRHISQAPPANGSYEICRRRTFRKFTYRGVDLEQLLDLGTEELIQLLPARARRRIGRGLKRKPLALIKKLREAKKNASAGECRTKPPSVGSRRMARVWAGLTPAQTEPRSAPRGCACSCMPHRVYCGQRH